MTTDDHCRDLFLDNMRGGRPSEQEVTRAVVKER